METEVALTEIPMSSQKQAILDVAQALFAQYGYEGVSIRDLAEQCGLAKATIYYHFRDKQAIFLTVLERDVLMVHQQAAQAVADEPGSALEKLRAVIATHCRLIEEKRSMVLSSLQSGPELQAELRRTIREHRFNFLGPLAQLVQQGIDEGFLRPIDVQASALCLLGMIQATMVYRLLLGDSGIDNEVADRMLDIFLVGVRKTADR